MKFATAREANEAVLAALPPVIAILKQIEDCERRLGEVQQQLGSAKAEHKSLTDTITAQLAQRDQLHRENEELAKEITASRQQHQQVLAKQQAQLDNVVARHAEAEKRYNQMIAQLKTIINTGA